MNKFTIRDTEIAFDHKTVPGSGNNLVEAESLTRIYIVGPLGLYHWGTLDGELSEDDVRARVEEVINISKERKYGQQQPTERKGLLPIRDRGRGINGIRNASMSQRR